MNSGLEQYVTFETAYRWLNCEFFGGSLPGAILTWQRHAGAYGFFSPTRYTSKNTGERSGFADEIGMNPDQFARPDIEIFATLLHEMCHQWQVCFGKPSRGGYHNSEWADKMEECGLTPSDTGQPGGKRTGQHMTHCITPGGRFEAAYAEKQFKINWVSNPVTLEPVALPGNPGTNITRTPPRKAPISKQKFTCPTCGQNAWAKPSAHLICGDCNLPMVAQDS
jgi:hypothetical protein